jgi:hypothetical protein
MAKRRHPSSLNPYPTVTPFLPCSGLSGGAHPLQDGGGPRAAAPLPYGGPLPVAVTRAATPSLWRRPKRYSLEDIVEFDMGGKRQW